MSENWSFWTKMDFWNSVGQVMSKSRLSLFHLLWTRCHLVLSPLVRNAALWAHKKQRKLYCFKVFSTSCCTPNSFQRLKICKVLQNSLVHFICCLARFVKFVMYQRLWSWMSKVSRASCWNHNEHHPDHFFISQRAGKNVVHEKLCVTKSYQSLVLW